MLSILSWHTNIRTRCCNINWRNLPDLMSLTFYWMRLTAGYVHITILRKWWCLHWWKTSQYDGLGNVLLGNIGSYQSYGRYFVAYYIREHQWKLVYTLLWQQSSKMVVVSFSRKTLSATLYELYWNGFKNMKKTLLCCHGHQTLQISIELSIYRIY